MFEYKIYCGDYSIAGYAEELTYHGTDRKKALNAYRETKNWLGLARVELSVLGREKHHQSRNEMVDFNDDFEYVKSDLDCYIFEDGTHGFMNPYSDSPKYDLDIFQNYAGHGKVVFHYIGSDNCEDITGWVREFDSH